MLTFQTFAAPCRVLAMYSAPEDKVTSRASLLDPTTTCWLPRLPAASYDFLLPPTTTCCLPRLPAASHDYLRAPRLPATSHDTCSPTTCCPPRNGGTMAMVVRKDDNTTGEVLREKGW